MQNGKDDGCIEGGAKMDDPPAAAEAAPTPAPVEVKSTAVNSSEPKSKLLELGTIIRNKWRITTKIGQGAFGETYVGESLEDASVTVAIKIERPRENDTDVLKAEVIALKKLQSCPHVVRYYNSGKDEARSFSFLVMERLGADLADLKRKTQKPTYELATCIRLGMQMLRAIQGVHERDFIHRDIKPSNFVIGRADTSAVYLIDFGLARRYRAADGEIRKARQPAGFRGTARYASINSHKSLELGRRDDLWCLFYVLVEFRLEVGLPWKRHKEKNIVGELKEQFTNEKLVESLPVEYKLFMDHLLSLRYESEPDYFYLNNLLESMASSAKVPLDQPMEWQRENFGKPAVPRSSKRHSQPDVPAVVVEQETKPVIHTANDPVPPPPLSLSPVPGDAAPKDDALREKHEREKERLRQIRREERQRGKERERLRKEAEAEAGAVEEPADVEKPKQQTPPPSPKRQKPPKPTVEVQHAKPDTQATRAPPPTTANARRLQSESPEEHYSVNSQGVPKEPATNEGKHEPDTGGCRGCCTIS
eukprot:TRINITY_DN714_c1_g2_i1.p1 TRINITY_DN714_c1_g2~~TRINITY_DN714_c1_g2_i1.p1  ORF type:complete len:535 (+),score=97.39 TRINITY_DN714_c1_g2_i1:61-1665(+)